MLFSLSRLTQLQELNLDLNDNCRDSFSVIGEMISLRNLSFDLHRVIFTTKFDDGDDVYGGDDDAHDNDIHSLFDLRR